MDMKYIIAAILFGLLAPFVWTPVISNLFVLYAPTSTTAFLLVGAVYSFICSLIIAAPLGGLLPKMKFSYWLVFIVSFLVSTTLGMYLYNKLSNFNELWGSSTTWAFVIGCLVAMYLGFNLKCRLTNRSARTR